VSDHCEDASEEIVTTAADAEQFWQLGRSNNQAGSDFESTEYSL
jgi:hypothetical protein